jgi:hypothetical protein
MDEKFLIANHLVPDNEVWVSPKTFENPFSKNVAEALPKAPNSQSIKLRQIIIELGKRGVIGASERDTAIVDEICKREGIIL